MMRRSFDLVAAALGLAMLGPAIAVAALAIRCTSPGPALYRQRRIGKGGQPFALYKLRTMKTGSGGTGVTVSADSRITPVGRLLRRLKIDELPQLWNVLRGDLSIIGPRPEVEQFVRQYSVEERRILEIRPGLASRAQLVYPHEAELLRQVQDPERAYVTHLMPRKIAVDLAYERERTFWTDVRLMGELILLVAGKAYRIDHNVSVNAN